MKRIIYTIILSFTIALPIYASTGVIDNSLHDAKVCHDTTCASPAPGIINFKPSSGTSVVIDSVTGLSGQIWGNELGWINLNPTGQGVTFENPATGTLIGKAWSQVSGWINFKTTGEQVYINPNNGQFFGYAWTGGPYGGWIKFDCGDSSTCVKSSWASPSSGGGGGGGGYRDVCPNIEGIQAVIPNGYTVSIDGMCIKAVDFCPNIVGDQLRIPDGFIMNNIGACIPNIDYCPNINGVQATIPQNYIVTEKGNCVLPKKDTCSSIEGIQYSTSECGAVDFCTNIPGIQPETPDGYVATNNYCFPKILDLCKNIDGNQTTVPEGNKIDENSNCLKEEIDICPNLGGHQSHIPLGFYMYKNVCLFGDENDQINNEANIPVIGFSFIPEKTRIGSDNVFLKDIVGAIVSKTGEFKVDLISVGISIFELFLLILLFVWITKRLMR